MKKSEIIKGVSKLYKDQFLTMATPGSGSWNLYQIPTGYALLKSKEGNMFMGKVISSFGMLRLTQLLSLLKNLRLL